MRGMLGNASACVRVRFQRHDVLPYAFCFNFLEATGSISFASPFFSLLPLFAFPFVVHSPIRRRDFRRHCSPSLVGAPRNVPRRFSAPWMLLGIYALILSLLSLPISPLAGFTPSSHLGLHRSPPHPVSRFPFPPVPFIPSSRCALSCRHPSVTE